MQARRFLRPDGQASVEFVALVPLFAVAALALAHLALAGHAAWAGAQAASAAARAHAVGLDATAAARSSLPPHLERRLRVRPGRDGRVELTLPVPTLLHRLDLGDIRVAAHFEPQS